MFKRLTITMTTAAMLFTSAGLMGCSSDESPDPGAPQLPPTASMTLERGFGFFKADDPGVTELAQSRINFATATFWAIAVSGVASAVLHDPAVAFALAIHTVPSKQDDGSYLWIYTASVNGEDFQVRLTGRPNGERVDWEMYAVLPGQDPFMWFRGSSHTQNDEGYWIFRGDPNENGQNGSDEVDIDSLVDALRVDWRFTSETDATLTFENIISGHEEEGDMLGYRVDSEEAAIEFTDFSESQVWDITWNHKTGTGSLLLPEYNNGERACWDVNKFDVDCGAAAPSILAGF